MTDPWTTAPGAEPAPLVGASDALAGAVTAVALVLLGAPAGLLWARLAPQLSGLPRAGAPGLDGPDPDAFVAADVTFGGVCLAAGVICGVVAYLLGRRYGPGVAVGLLAGGLVAAYVAKQTGRLVALDALREAVSDVADRRRLGARVGLRAVELVVAWPVGALIAFGALTAAEPEPAPGRVSSG